MIVKSAIVLHEVRRTSRYMSLINAAFIAARWTNDL